MLTSATQISCTYSEIVWLRAGWTAPTRANANRTTGLPNSYDQLTYLVYTDGVSLGRREFVLGS